MEDMIYIEDLIKFYFKKIPIVIFITLLFLQIGIIYEENSYEEYYQESATIILVTPEIPQDQVITNIGNLENYLILLNSKRLATNVINTLELDYSESYLLDHASFYMSSNSQMITITVIHRSDELASLIANTYVSELKKEVKSIYKIDNIMVLDAATTSENIVSFGNNSSLIFALAGFIISSGIIICIYCFNDNVRIMLRKESILGVELLKTISYKKKSNPFEVKDNKIHERFKKIKSIICRLLKENKVKTIMVTSDGNMFHSNYSVHLASSFTTVTQNVLLIDCNRFGKLSDHQTDGILDLINVPANTFSVKLKKYTMHLESLNMDFLPLGDLGKNSTDLFSNNKFITLLDKLKSSYDLIFIEVPDIINTFEGMVLSDLMDATIVVMKKNKVTTEKIKQLDEVIDKEKNKFLAIAPVKKKRNLKLKLKKKKDKELTS